MHEEVDESLFIEVKEDQPPKPLENMNDEQAMKIISQWNKMCSKEVTDEVRKKVILEMDMRIL
jgi:hypothetical protein